MKKTSKSKGLPVLALMGFLALGAFPISAQQNIPKESQSELYCINLPIEKIFPSRKGYVVIYRRGVNKVGTLYIPHDWFRVNNLKGQLNILGDGPTQPSMSIFYKEGAFHSVKLYLAKRSTHPSWGSLPSNVYVDDRFEGVEELKVQFQ
jgi:hypothetical protein